MKLYNSLWHVCRIVYGIQWDSSKRHTFLAQKEKKIALGFISDIFNFIFMLPPFLSFSHVVSDCSIIAKSPKAFYFFFFYFRRLKKFIFTYDSASEVMFIVYFAVSLALFKLFLTPKIRCVRIVASKGRGDHIWFLL